MNGAELLVKTAIASGIEVCFVNPGTTEMPLVRALDAVPGVRTILGLFEGVCTGAADGYGRILDKPAMTLFHQGPGLANGIANLHNAQQARTPRAQRHRRSCHLAPCGKPFLSPGYRGPGCHRIGMVPQNRVARNSLPRRGGSCSSGFARTNSNAHRAARLSSGRVE